jgi:hypothetical protein
MCEYKAIGAYVDPPDQDQWLECPVCGLRPRVWTYNNGMETACGCGESKYKHLSIFAESIMEVYQRTGKTAEFNRDDLRQNWNVYVELKREWMEE